MGGKKKGRPKPPEPEHRCPCGHEINERGNCLVLGPDHEMHEVPQSEPLCACHGMRIFEAPGFDYTAWKARMP